MGNDLIEHSCGPKREILKWTPVSKYVGLNLKEKNHGIFLNMKIADLRIL